MLHTAAQFDCHPERILRTMLRTLFTTLVLTGLPLASHADTLDQFTLNGTNLSVSFQLSATPTVSTSYSDLGFEVATVAVTANGKKLTARPAQFNLASVGGGFALRDDDDLLELKDTSGTLQSLAYSGPQFFTGSVSNPTFLLGNYTLLPLYCPGSDPDRPSSTLCPNVTYNLNIAQVSSITPEPGSLVLLATGLLGVAGTVQHRRWRQGR